MKNNNIDYKRLRECLIHYFGAGIYIIPVAVGDLVYVQTCLDEELVDIASLNGIDINDFLIHDDELEK